jgi:hypothetical protein
MPVMMFMFPNSKEASFMGPKCLIRRRFILNAFNKAKVTISFYNTSAEEILKK